MSKDKIPRRRAQPFSYPVGVRVEAEIGEMLKALKEVHFVDTPGLLRSAITKIVRETWQKEHKSAA